MPVAEISDAPGKSMCEDPDSLRYLASAYRIDLNVLNLAA